METKTITRLERLEQEEAIIQRGLDTFVEVGTALGRIKEDHLYADKYGFPKNNEGWERYLRERWQMSREHGRRLIAAAEVAGIIAPMGAIPATERVVRSLAEIKDDPDGVREVWQGATANGKAPTAKEVRREVDAYRTRKAAAGVITLSAWRDLSESARLEKVRQTDDRARFNKQDTTNIEWAMWSWNPVTGCLHNCPYCYARDIATRFYEQKFEPSLVPSRLWAPMNTAVPAQAENYVGYRNVFTCSMADLFGKWVPDEWIHWIFEVIERTAQWNYLFLTKFPQRLVDTRSLWPSSVWPKHAWMGASVDRQDRVALTMKAFERVRESGHQGVRWLSLEPLLEPLRFVSLEMFDWIVIGGASRSTQTPQFAPPSLWVERLVDQARRDGVKVYFKENLRYRPREYPFSHDDEGSVPAAFNP